VTILRAFHDRANAHRQRLMGDVLFAEEVAGSRRGASPVERHHGAVGYGVRPGLVEANVPARPMPRICRVDAAGPANLLFVAAQYLSMSCDDLKPSGCGMLSD